MTERLIYMKSYLLLLTLFLFGFTLIGCDKTPKEKDTIPPLLTVYETTIKIRIGEPLDLMQGGLTMSKATSQTESPSTKAISIPISRELTP